MSSETVGTRIAALRRARGWTQHDLAAEVGVYRPLVSRWESGGATPSTPHFWALVEALDTSADYLWRGERP